jgi:hypothetical protein
VAARHDAKRRVLGACSAIILCARIDRVAMTPMRMCSVTIDHAGPGPYNRVQLGVGP